MKNNIFSKTLLTTTAISLCLPGDSYAGLKSQDRLVETATIQAAQRGRVLAESHAANIQRTFTDTEVVQKVHVDASHHLKENITTRARGVANKPTMEAIVDVVDLVCRIEAKQTQCPDSPHRKLVAAIDRLIPTGGTSAAMEASVQAFEQITSGFQRPGERPAHYVSPQRLIHRYRVLLGEAASSRARKLFQEDAPVSQRADEGACVDSLSAAAHAVFLPSASTKPAAPSLSSERVEEGFPGFTGSKELQGHKPATSISLPLRPLVSESSSAAGPQSSASIKAAITKAVRNHRPNALQQRVAAQLLKKKTDAAVEIQRIFRGHVARTQFLNAKAAANTIARSFKGFQARKQLAKLRTEYKAATSIQSLFRGYMVRKNVAQMEKAATRIQQAFRGHLKTQAARTQFIKMREATTTIAKTFKGYKARRDFVALQDATLKAQTLTRAYLARKQLATLKAEHLRVSSAATTLQQIFRAKLAGKTARAEYVKTRDAVVDVQRVFRGFRVRQKTTALRAQLAAALLKKQAAAATEIQRIFRGHVARIQFLKMRDAANTISRMFRAFQTRQQLLKIQRDQKRQQALNLRTAEAFQKMKLLRNVFASWKTHILMQKLAEKAPLPRSPLAPYSSPTRRTNSLTAAEIKALTSPQAAQRRLQELSPKKLLEGSPRARVRGKLTVGAPGSKKSWRERERIQLPDQRPSLVIGRVLTQPPSPEKENLFPADVADQSDGLYGSPKSTSAPSSPARSKVRKTSHRRSHSSSLKLPFGEIDTRPKISPVAVSTPPDAHPPSFVLDLSPIAWKLSSGGSALHASFSFDDTRGEGRLNAAVAEIVDDSMLPNGGGHLSVVDSMLADGHLSAMDESTSSHRDISDVGEDGSLPSGRVFSPLFRSLYGPLPSTQYMLSQPDHDSFQVTEVLPSDRESVLEALSPHRPVYVECSAAELQNPADVVQRTLRKVGNLDGAPIILIEKASLSQEIAARGRDEGAQDSSLSQQGQAPVEDLMPRRHATSASALSSPGKSSSRVQESLLERVLDRITALRGTPPKLSESSMLADGEAHLSPGAAPSGEGSMLREGHLSPVGAQSVDGSMMPEGHLSAVDSMLSDGEAHLSPGVVVRSAEGSMLREGDLSQVAAQSVDGSMMREGHLSAVDSMLSDGDLSQVNSMLDGSAAHLSPVKGSNDSMLASSAAHLSPTVQSPPVQVFVIRQ